VPGQTDKAKGKLKEEIGERTDDEKLKREGKQDQAKGWVKDAWDDMKDAADKVRP
jgi:uncharacterized protein YjbJ (UPF0337 family)